MSLPTYMILHIYESIFFCFASKLSYLVHRTANFCQFTILRVNTDGATFIKSGKMVNISAVVLLFHCCILSEDYKAYQISFQIVQMFFANLCLYSLCSKRKSLESILGSMNLPNFAVFKIQPGQRRKIFLKYYINMLPVHTFFLKQHFKFYRCVIEQIDILN